jgi:mannitol/fructose-specific phosphotransferase system IIA component (Ntr-type)
MIPTLIESALIVEALAATDKEAALAEILQAVVDAGHIARRDVAAIKKALLQREVQGSTGIGNGIAVPHVRGKEVKRMQLVLARSQAGVEFQALDGKPVHTVFLILAPASEVDAHLQALRWISKLARNSDFRRFVMRAAGAEQVRELLHEMG